MNKYRLHIVGTYHLPAQKKYLSCAYTQKIIKQIEMFRSLGHEVIFYGAKESETNATEQVPVITLNDIRESFGDGDNRWELGYNWRDADTYRYDKVYPLSRCQNKWVKNTIEELKKRAGEDDFLLLPQSEICQPIAKAVNIPMTCETGIGYRGSFARFRAFESEYIRNFTYGTELAKGEVYPEGNFMDRVIPNYFDGKDFPTDLEYTKGDYFLYIGRVIAKKGVHIAYALSRHFGKKLIIAGQYDKVWGAGWPDAEYVGVVNDPIEKAKLFGNAIATLVPTVYAEPFGGVNVESQLCGTPVLTTNFGAFPETVKHGETGFLCDTFDDFVKAAEKARDLNPISIRKHAERYLMDNVKWEFQKWFDDIYDFVQEAKKGNKEPWFKIRDIKC